ncbi:alpha/beta fold hydrolase [Actinomadura syzygii]|uniref:Alpha/beta hydrolase n=1 Tax=Actinomadura syzygii TaxID=1427538 RepID=A0A5D0U6C0_9ACTN|nr:alpha/beta hydrolase [Actinomadura syzygii]TYC13216.1 alpha/beta hydrolase [Actinomadura syzygii]
MIAPMFSPHYARTRSGLMHYVEMGAGEPLLLLHQTPRSWDEFRLLMPLLAEQRRVIAPDIIGYGASESIPDHSIERYADSVLALLEELGLDRVDLLGHQLGGIIAIEMSHRRPERLRRLVLSGTPYVDEEFRRERPPMHPLSMVELQDDGRHLMELWVRRSGFYPPARPDLLNRYVRDVLLLEDQAEDGHRAISTYRMEGRTGYRGPVLCIGATADPIAFHQVPRLVERLPQARLEIIQGGMVPLMEQLPEEVAALVSKFLDETVQADSAYGGTP